MAISLIWWRWWGFFNLDKTDAFPLKEALVRSMPLGVLSSILLFQVLVLINDTYRVPTPVLFLHSLVPICLGVIQAARLYRNYKRRIAGKPVVSDLMALNLSPARHPRALSGSARDDESRS